MFPVSSRKYGYMLCSGLVGGRSGCSGGTPRPKPGEKCDPKAPRASNGISGDPRRSSAELGKRFIDLKVDYAVKTDSAVGHCHGGNFEVKLIPIGAAPA